MLEENYTNTQNQNPNNYVSNNIIDRTKTNVKSYIKYRLKEEARVKRIKSKLDTELKEIAYSLYEDGLSCQRINAARVIFKKSRKYEHITERHEMIKTIFNILVDNFVTGFADTEYRYIKNRDLVEQYLNKYLDNKEHIDKIKQEMNKELKIRKSLVTSLGLDTHYLEYMYKNVKKELSFINKVQLTNEELASDLYTDVRRSMKLLEDEIVQEEINVIFENSIDISNDLSGNIEEKLYNHFNKSSNDKRLYKVVNNILYFNSEPRFRFNDNKFFKEIGILDKLRMNI